MNVNGSKWIRPEKRRRIYKRDGHRCLWCNQACKPGKWTTLDHFLPRQLGGSNAADNLFTACLACNSRRHHDSALEYAYHFPDPAACLERIFKAVETPPTDRTTLIAKIGTLINAKGSSYRKRPHNTGTDATVV